MPFLSLDNNWSNLAPLYNQNFNGKPTVPKKIDQFNSFDDGFIRGGLINATLASVKDVKRISSSLLNLKGSLFIIKQAGLQLTNPRLEWKGSPDKQPPFLGGPTRQFTGVGSLLSIGGNAFGLHFDRAGLLGTIDDEKKYGGNINKPISGVVYQNNFGAGKESNQTIKDNSQNRLVRYLSKIVPRQTATINYDGTSLPSLGVIGPTQPAFEKFNKTNNSIILNKYLGGPESVYGIGQTSVKSYIDRTTIRSSDLGTSNRSGTLSTLPNLGSPDSIFSLGQTTTSTSNPVRQNQSSPSRNRRGTTVNESGRMSVTITSPNIMQRGDTPTLGTQGIPDIIGAATTNPDLVLKLNGFIPLTNNEIIDAGNVGGYYNSFSKESLNTQLSKSPLSYNQSAAKYNIESRMGISHGGNKKQVDSINSINIIDSNVFYNAVNSGELSSNINGKYPNSSIYDSNKKEKLGGEFGKDIVKFRLEFLNNNTPVQNIDNNTIINTDVLAFRAYIDDFNDGLNAKWNSYRYMGRGEDFYVYEGFTRDVSVTFTIFAHTSEEMKPIYQKLNYLISTFTPDYSDSGKMRGNIGYLTIGDYIYRQPGVFTDIKLGNMLDNHWEINLDGGHNEVPKYIKVTLSFKPIHDFVPRKVTKENPFLSNFILPKGDANAYKI